MAEYKFKCLKCKKKTNLTIPITQYNRDNVYKCKCKGTLSRVITAPRIRTTSSPNRY